MQVSYNSLAANQLGKIVWNICQALQGMISFGTSIANNDPSQNIQGVWATATITTANAAQNITLNPPLNHVPVGYIVMLKDRVCDVYASSADQGNWTASKLVIRGSVISAEITLFVI